MEMVAKIKRIPLPREGEWEKLFQLSPSDFATLVSIHGAQYIILPYRSTIKGGAFRRHFIRPNDYVPESALNWRKQGWEYLCFPYSGQRIVSIYRSNTGIVRVQVVEPTGRVINLGSTSLEAAYSFVHGMHELYGNGEVYKVE